MFMRLPITIMFLCTTIQILCAERYVLTGGPGVGKSTVIAELARRGYLVLPETYAALYDQAAAKNALEAFFSNPLALYAQLMSEQLRLEALLPDAASAFLDRSTIDVIAFGTYFNVPMNQEFRNQAQRTYDFIFFIEPLPEECYRNSLKRKESPDESAIIHSLVKETYRDYGYTDLQCIDVPYDSPSKRADFILDVVAHINSVVG